MVEHHLCKSAPTSTRVTRQNSVMKHCANNPFYKSYDEEEKIYFTSLSDVDKALMVAEEEGAFKATDQHVPVRFKILRSKIDMGVKNIAMKKIYQISRLDKTSSEYYKTMRWTTALCDIPVGVYKNLPVDASSATEQVREFILTIKANLDAKVFGHHDAKDQILRLLCQWIANPDSKGMVIGIQGPMGCGKTTLVKEGICQVLGLPFAFIPLGGASGSDYLDGHSFTYEGSMWGKIVSSLMQCKCMNPVFFFDELDKVSDTQRGEEVINYFIHLTDSSQNDRITDKFFPEVELDLSRSLIIFSYNDESRVSPILRDRMFRIYTKGYDTNDKKTLVRDYLLPEVLAQYGLKAGQIIVPDPVVSTIVGAIDKEDGVRNLKRGLQDIVGHINMKRLMEAEFELPFTVRDEDVRKFVSVNKGVAMDVSVQNMYM